MENQERKTKFIAYCKQVMPYAKAMREFAEKIKNGDNSVETKQAYYYVRMKIARISINLVFYMPGTMDNPEEAMRQIEMFQKMEQKAKEEYFKLFCWN